MSTIITRASKGQALTWQEGDENIVNLNTDKIELTDISASTVSGDGTLTYNSSTGEFSYTGPDETNYRGAFTSGTGIDITNGEISTSALLDVVEDTSPQLGGNLDVNNKTITNSITDGNVDLQGNGNGRVRVTGGIFQTPTTWMFSNLYFANSPTFRIWEAYDNSNIRGLEFFRARGSSFNPQPAAFDDLVFKLSVQTQHIDGRYDAFSILSFAQSDSAGLSANNETRMPVSTQIRVFNQDGSLTRVAGWRTNSNYFEVNGLAPFAGRKDDLELVSYNNGNIDLSPNGTGNVVLSGINYPTSDGSNGQVLTTDGSGNLSFTTPSSGISNVVEDTTPQLGGDLDAQGNKIQDVELDNYKETIHGLGTTDTPSIDVANGNVQTVTISSGLALPAFTNAETGQSVTLLVSGSGTATGTADYKFAGGATTLTTSSVVSIFYDGTSYWCSISTDYQ